MAEVKKMRCTLSHERPSPVGGWVYFEAGREYPIKMIPGGSPYFEPVVEEKPKKAGKKKEDMSDGSH